jgi:hypothetical protein
MRAFLIVATVSLPRSMAMVSRARSSRFWARRLNIDRLPGGGLTAAPDRVPGASPAWGELPGE